MWVRSWSQLLFFYRSFSFTSVSKFLQHWASFPLLCTDNELLHSPADSSSPKATLIVLKHTAPVKLIIVLDCCHIVAGPVTQRVRGFSAQPASCPLSRTHTTFQMCSNVLFSSYGKYSTEFLQLKAHWIFKLDKKKINTVRLLLQHTLYSNLCWQSGFGLLAGT